MTEVKYRVERERDDVSSRIDKLHSFMHSPNFETLDDAQQYLLKKQFGVMLDYREILEARLSIME